MDPAVTQNVTLPPYLCIVNLLILLAMKSNKLQISCPNCGHEFSPEAALEGHLRAHLEKEYAEKNAISTKIAEDRARSAAQLEYESKIEALEKDRRLQSQKLREFEKKSLDLAERERELDEREERTELDIKRRLLDQKEAIREEAEKFAFEKVKLEFQEREAALRHERETLELTFRKEGMLLVEKAREEEKMRYAELQKKYEEQTRLAEEMRRKAEQGSMQLQGEVQELAIEEFLRSAFPKDEIEEITKGARGADCLHIVKDPFGNECGRILYESKRTKNFSREWIKKLKEDARLKGSNLEVIVTEAMPSELQRFGQIDGVWICSFAEFKSLCLLLRSSLLRIGEVVAAQENKGEKMQLLYDYLTGNEFRQRVDAIREAFENLSADLQKERCQAIANFAKREKQIYKVMENTVALYGEVRGIAGGAVQAIPALEDESDSPQLLREAV